MELRGGGKIQDWEIKKGRFFGGWGFAKKNG